jgi:hypothetical protein
MRSFGQAIRQRLTMATSPSAPATAPDQETPGPGAPERETAGKPPSDLLVVVLFSATLLVSAALLFLIQPMFARFVLPLVGGTPAVWNVSLMFFQLALLTSYLYAHVAIRRLGVRRQALIHLVLLLPPLIVLPIGVPTGTAPPQGGEILWLLGVLFTAVGLPFFVVASTAPMVQRWLAAMDHPRAADPYFLYRASNLGSVVGLLAYPLLMEPQLRLGDQGALWAWGYVLLVVLVAACAATLFLSPTVEKGAAEDPIEEEPAEAERPTLRDGLRWTFLGFVPSALMLGVTGFLTTDLAPIPLLWVIPLTLYLLSFIVVFSPATRAPIAYKVSIYLLPPLALALVVALIYELRTPFRLIAALHLAFFFVAALACHGRLANERPHPRFLTGFYLWLALGGALGGTFIALVAPLIFNGRTEYPLAVVLACFALPAAAMSGSLERAREFVASLLLGRRIEPAGTTTAAREPTRLRTEGVELRLDVILPIVIGAVLLAALWLLGPAEADEPTTRRNVVYGLMAIGCLATVGRPLRFGLSVAAMLVAATIAVGQGSVVIESDRSFFSELKVESYGDGRYKRLLNGTTLHGGQITLPGQALVPITYYHPTSPVGELVTVLRRRGLTERSAVVGLGTGSMACHSRRGERWTFLEVDPLVERIARTPRLFSYLSDCRGTFDVVLGDARVSMARDASRRYGMITLDAFSSDAIPTHLLTREAIELYKSRLEPGGALAFHISNRYLELEPVLGDVARSTRMACIARLDTATDRRGRQVPGKTLSHWVMLARRQSDFGRLATQRNRWRPCTTGASAQPWTDDYSNILSVVSW